MHPTRTAAALVAVALAMALPCAGAAEADPAALRIEPTIKPLQASAKRGEAHASLKPAAAAHTPGPLTITRYRKAADGTIETWCETEHPGLPEGHPGHWHAPDREAQR